MYGKELLDATTKSGLDPGKVASKKVVHKTTEATGELIGNKITENIMKPKPLPAENSRNDEKNKCSTREKRRNIKRIKTSIIKMEHHKISKLLNDSTAPK